MGFELATEPGVIWKVGQRRRRGILREPPGGYTLDRAHGLRGLGLRRQFDEKGKLE